MTTTFEVVRDKVLAGERVDRADGLFLLAEASLLDLGQLAAEVRRKRHPESIVTFVIDTNPNYTNVCNVDCTFCAFYRSPGHEEAYTHSVEEMLERIGRSAEKGVTTVLMQGGVNSELPLDYYLELVRAVRERYPQVTPHFWSAVEIEGMAAVSGLSLREVLRALKDQGYRVGVFSDKRIMFGGPELEQAGVGELVDYALFLEEGRPYKPDPTGLRQVLDALEVSPGETLYVGDSRHDVQCAHRAGVTSAAALWGSVDREGVLARQPHHSLEQVEQIFQALGDPAPP